MSFAEGAVRVAGRMGAAFGWTPDAFWRATPAEVLAVVRALTGDGGEGDDPCDGATVDRLKERFPDG